ncbi:MAG: hypothetical protein J7M12_04095, partial [Candidatus Hydrogenedentes bacterium]|nr:hypothetical protein [Candidatus Hydrogenedentota bacterium]
MHNWRRKESQLVAVRSFCSIESDVEVTGSVKPAVPHLADGKQCRRCIEQIEQLGGLLDVPYYDSWADDSVPINDKFKLIRRYSRAAADIFGETFGTEISDPDRNSTVTAELLDLFDTSATLLTVGQVWDRGFDATGNF